jgi:TonB-dependent SusC/RagA subfamily outer membrane receptor
MPALFIYLLKANAALILFYLAYRFVLRRLTFYTLNRYFLLLGIFLSALFPLINLRDLFTAGTGLVEGVTYYAPDWRVISRQVQQPEHLTVWSVLAYLFWAGVLVMGVRFLIQLTSLMKIHTRTTDGKCCGHPVKLMGDDLNPFSFFRNIYVNPRMHRPGELQAIIRHERIHVKGWHSADILAGELNQIFYWFNPGAWLMRKAIGENLEFMTDRSMLRSGADPKSYQYSLVRISSAPYASALANNFNLAHLKKRIMMMNKKRSSRVHLIRYLLVLPVVALTALVITASRAQNNTLNLSLIPGGQQTLAQGTDSIPEAGVSEAPPSPDYQAFLKRNPSVSGLQWMMDTERQTRSVKLRLKNGQSEVYRLGKPSDERKAKQKYGPLPPPPPPPTPHSNSFFAEGQGLTALGHVKGKSDTDRMTISADKIMIKARPDSMPYQQLFVVDGKVQDSTFSIASIPPDRIRSITVLKGSSGTTLYGARGKNGVIMLKTRPGVNVLFKQDTARGDSGLRRVRFDRAGSVDSPLHAFHAKSFETVEEGYPAGRDSFYFRKDSPSSPKVIGFTSANPGGAHSTRHFSEVTFKDGKHPLYVVDFNIVDSKYMQKMKPGDIQSIQVVKGDRAVKLFGKKGKNGVVLITTKQRVTVKAPNK